MKPKQTLQAVTDEAVTMLRRRFEPYTDTCVIETEHLNIEVSDDGVVREIYSYSEYNREHKNVCRHIEEEIEKEAAEMCEEYLRDNMDAHDPYLYNGVSRYDF